jgi:hypothetical protein
MDMMYTYRPKMGDVVVFPNGIELNYSEHDETVVVLHPSKTVSLRVEDGEEVNLWKLTVTP